MKKTISLALLCATTSLVALDAEHAYLYKDPRIMGMGGANVAVGGFSTSLFSNPAGLASIKKEHGLVFDLLGASASLSQEFQSFANDIADVETDTAVNPNATNDMVNILANYSGNHFHFGLDNYSSISKNSDSFAWSLGLLTASDINYKVHANGGASFLETSSRVYGGVNLGIAKTYMTKIGRLDIGLGVKYISQLSYEGGLDINDLISEDNDFAKKMQDKYEKNTSGFGADIGVNYKPLQDSFLKPTIGLSILNIGSMGMDDSYGQQPMTVNLGVSISPDVPLLNSLVVAVDYMDVLNSNKVRFYDISALTVATTDLEDADIKKRLRLGVGVGLIDKSMFSLAVNGGLYQGSYTAGVNMEILLLKLNFATYEEEIGLGSASNKDRRYVAKLGIGW